MKLSDRIPCLGEIQCGFPSPAADYQEADLNLHELMVKKPAATFFMRAKGLSMTGAGIYPEDVLVVDRSLDPKSGSIVVASVNGGFTLKRFVKENGKAYLKAENPDFKPIEITHGMNFQIFGVVTFNVHRLA